MIQKHLTKLKCPHCGGYDYTYEWDDESEGDSRGHWICAGAENEALKELVGIFKEAINNTVRGQ